MASPNNEFGFNIISAYPITKGSENSRQIIRNITKESSATKQFEEIETSVSNNYGSFREEKRYALSEMKNESYLYGHNITTKHPKTLGKTRVYFYVKNFPLLSIGPNIFRPLLTLILISFLYIMFFCTFYEGSGYIFQYSFHILFFFYFINHFLSIFINPGIPSVKYNLDNLTIKRNNNSSYSREYSYCKRCGLNHKIKDKIIHCYDCDICYYEIYKHSKWTGHCVAKYNFVFYVLYSLCQWTLFLVFFSMLFVNILKILIENKRLK